MKTRCVCVVTAGLFCGVTTVDRRKSTWVCTATRGFLSVGVLWRVVACFCSGSLSMSFLRGYRLFISLPRGSTTVASSRRIASDRGAGTSARVAPGRNPMKALQKLYSTMRGDCCQHAGIMGCCSGDENGERSHEGVWRWGETTFVSKPQQEPAVSTERLHHDKQLCKEVVLHPAKAKILLPRPQVVDVVERAADFTSTGTRSVIFFVVNLFGYLWRPYGVQPGVGCWNLASGSNGIGFNFFSRTISAPAATTVSSFAGNLPP
jgi:hypothetical protein